MGLGSGSAFFLKRADDRETLGSFLKVSCAERGCAAFSSALACAPRGVPSLSGAVLISDSTAFEAVFSGASVVMDGDASKSKICGKSAGRDASKDERSLSALCASKRRFSVSSVSEGAAGDNALTTVSAGFRGAGFFAVMREASSSAGSFIFLFSKGGWLLTGSAD